MSGNPYIWLFNLAIGYGSKEGKYNISLQREGVQITGSNGDKKISRIVGWSELDSLRVDPFPRHLAKMQKEIGLKV